MTSADILKRTISVISNHWSVEFKAETEELSAESTLDQFDCDSLDAIEIIMMLEESFETDLPDDELFLEMTIGDLVKVIGRCVGDWGGL